MSKKSGTYSIYNAKEKFYLYIDQGTLICLYYSVALTI